MKSFIRLVIILTFFSVQHVFAVTNTWQGGTGGALNWQTAGNWSQNHAPQAGEDVVFNTSGTITFTTGVGSSVALNSLQVLQGNVTVIGAAAYTLTLGGNAGDDFVIANGASFTLSTNLSITMAASSTADISGAFTINSSRTWTITNATTCTISTSGSISNAGTITGATSSILIFNGASTYYHNQNGGTIPTASWNGTSTCDVNGMTSTAPTGISTNTFYNLKFSTSTLASRTGIGQNMTVNGDLTISLTLSANLCVSNSGTTAYTWTIGGNLNFSSTSGTFNFISSAAGAANHTVTVGGNFNMTGGMSLDFINSGSSQSGSTLNFNIAGNFTHTAGTLNNNNDATVNINLNGTGTQLIESTGQGSGAGTVGQEIIFNTNQTGASAKVRVDNGKTFVLQYGKFVVQNNASNDTELDIYGSGIFTISSTATSFTINANTGISVASNATFTTNISMTNTNNATWTINGTFNLGAGTVIPTATWASTSNCNLTYLSSSNITGIGSQSFGNFTIDNTGNTIGANIQMDAVTPSFAGNFTITSLGGVTSYGVYFFTAAAVTHTMTITGNFSVSHTNGYFKFQNGNFAGPNTVNLSGDFTQSGAGGTIDYNNTSANLAFNFAGSTNQTFTKSAGTLTNTYINWTVNSGSILTLASDLPVAASRTATVNGTIIFNSSNVTSGSGTTTISSGATVYTAHASGLSTTATTGSVQTTSKSYSSGAAYIFNGNSAQVTGNFVASTSPSANTVASLTFNNNYGVTMSGNITVSDAGTLTLTKGFHNLATYTLTLGTSSATTLTYGTGGLYSSTNAGYFTRYIPTGAVTSTSGNFYGLFPMKNNKFELNSTSNVTGAGTFTVRPYTGASTTVDVSLVDDHATIDYILTGNQIVATKTITGGTFDVKYTFNSFNTTGNASDIGLATYTGSAIGYQGAYLANSGTKSIPVVSRTGVSTANLAQTWVVCTYDNIASPIAVLCGSISGIKTVGPTTGTDYSNLTDAFADIVANGIAGATYFELQTDYTSTTETFPITIGSIGSCASSTNALIVRPASTAVSITGSNTSQLLYFNGGNYVTFDGRPSSTGSNKYLTISNTNTGGGSAITFVNDASNNTLTYCNISSKYLSASTGVIGFSTTSGTTGNDNNTISYCIIDGTAGATASPTSGVAVNGIYSAGTAAKTNSGNIVTYCEFKDMYDDNASATTSFILLSSNNDSWQFTYNSFYQSNTRTSTGAHTFNGIKVNDGSGYTITNNSFGGSAASCSGTWTQNSTGSNYTIFYGIYLSVGTSSTTSVQANTFKGLTWDIKGANDWACIYITSGNVNVGTTSANTIGATGSAGSISLINTTGTPNVYGIYSSSTGTINIQNNTIGSISTCNCNLSFNVYGIYTSGAAGIYTISSNTIGGSLNYIRLGGASTSSANKKFYGIYNTATGLTTISSNTIQYITVYGTSGAPTFAGIFNTGGADNSIISSNTISNITNAGTGSTGVNYGIYVTNVATMTIGSNTISTFTIENGSVNGIYLAPATSSSKTYTVSSNSIVSITAASTTGANTAGDFCGINVYSKGNTFNFNTNLIRNLNGSNTGPYYYINGIYVTTNTTDPAVNFTGNTIEKLINSSTTTGSTNAVYGIQVGSASSTACVLKKNFIRYLAMAGAGTNSNITGISMSTTSNTFVNNFVRIYNDDGSSTYTTIRSPIRGISVPGSGATNVFYYNTVVIGGTTPDLVNTQSYCLYIPTGGTHTVKNNIFQNTRTGNSSNLANYTLYTGTAGGSTTTFNNNYYANSTTSTFAYYNGAAYTNVTYNNASYGGTSSSYATSGLTIGTDAAVTEVASITGITDLYTTGGTDCREDINSNTSIRNVSGQAGAHQGCYEGGAGNYYWVGGTGNWSDYSNHWAYTSGGPACALAVPSSSSNVYFDANSSAGICTIDATAYASSFISTGYTGTIAGSSSLDIYGSMTLGASSSWTHTGTLSFKSTSVGNTITTNAVSMACPITFNGSGGAWTLGGDLTSTSSSALTLSAGTLSLSSYNLSIAGDFTKATAFTFTPSTGTVTFTGNSSAINGTTAAPSFYNIVVNKTAGQTLSTGGSITSLTCTNNFTETTGNFTAPASMTVTGNVTITAGTFISSSGILSIAGNFTNNSTFTSNSGTVTFNGGAAQSISGTSDPNFYNLTISNSSTGVTLGLNTTMTNTLTLSSGLFKTATYTLTLGTTSGNATIPAGSSSSYIVAYDNAGSIGYVKQYINGNATYNYPIGDATHFTPLTFQLTANGGLSSAYFTVYTKAASIPGMKTGTLTSYITRHWNGIPSGLTTPTYTISYIYDDNDLVGVEANLLPVKFSGGTTWYAPTGSSFTSTTLEGNGSVNVGSNTLTWSGLTTFSLYGGAGNQASALPIELLGFDATLKHRIVELTWKTASEKNADYFEIERSSDGINFDLLLKKKAVGNSTTLINYSSLDTEPLNGISYYRLKEYDLDGKYTYSPIRTINLEVASVFSVYPNPIIENTYSVEISNSTQFDNQSVELVFYDQTGRIVYQDGVIFVKGKNTYQLVKPNLTAGIYTLKIVLGGQQFERKIIIE